MKLSVVIITYNEERNIMRCLKSVQEVADEIVILDSCSDDCTAELCADFPKVRFYEQPFLGHIEQKNKAMQLARGTFVLSLDADEELSEELAENVAIWKRTVDASADGYTMNRRNNYAGQWIRYGGWYPDRKLRLWRKSKGHWAGKNPHDKIEMATDAKIRHMKGDILHYSYLSIAEHYKKSKRYAQISAKAKYEDGKSASLLQVYGAPVLKFIQSYFLQMGFLEGYHGLMIAWISALEKYWKYDFLRKMRYANNT